MALAPAGVLVAGLASYDQPREERADGPARGEDPNNLAMTSPGRPAFAALGLAGAAVGAARANRRRPVRGTREGAVGG